MAEKPKCACRWRVWTSLGAIGLTCIVVVTFRIPSPPKRPLVLVDTNGIPRLHGIPLAQQAVRDGVFRTMGALRSQVSFGPMSSSNATAAQMSNLIDTVNAMTRAGLFPTNQALSNRYE